MHLENLIFDFKASKTYYDEELGIITIVWNEAPDSEEYRKPFLYMQNFAKKANSIISDITNQGVISVSDRHWFETEMFPKAIKAGLKAAAIVTSDNPFKKYYINMLFLTFKKFGVPMKAFSSRQSAKEWIKEQGLV